MLVEAPDLVDRFQSMIRMKAASDLEAWVTETSKSQIASFAAITEPWSNGQTEGHTRLKLVKRQMYGREKLDCSATIRERSARQYG